jgi:hypothetical protein
MRKAVTRSAILASALCAVIFISFPSFPSTLGIVSKPQLVDRALKGDRLTNAPALENGRTSHPAGKHVPVGCDRAFNSMLSPQFSRLFGRCLV